MSSIDYKALKAIPIDSILAHYGVPTRKRNSKELVADCPFPSHEKSEHAKGTLCISLESNIFYCHSDSCRAASNKPKGGDVIDAVAMMENLTLKEAAQKLLTLYKPGEGERKQTPVLEGNKPLAFELKGVAHEHEALKKKGISMKVAESYGVGYFPGKGSMANRIIFPLYENGQLIGYAGRTLGEVTPENPKWKLPAGLVRSFVYGLDKCDASKPLILCESPWAVLWFKEQGMQAAALLGSSMTEAQEQYLEPFKVITLAMDADEPGREAARKLAARLRQNHKVTVAHLKG